MALPTQAVRIRAQVPIHYCGTKPRGLMDVTYRDWELSDGERAGLRPVAKRSAGPHPRRDADVVITATDHSAQPLPVDESPGKARPEQMTTSYNGPIGVAA